MVSNVSTTGQSVPPPEQHHDSKVDLSPSSPVSMSSSSTSLGESLDSSNQETKKKKKSTKKEVDHVIITPNSPSMGKPYVPPRKVRFPCRFCKGDHLLQDYPGIPKILEVWSQDLNRPSPSTFGDHVDATPSASDGKRKGKIRFPCRLCEGKHLLHLCPLMDKASKILENLTAPQPQLHVGY